MNIRDNKVTAQPKATDHPRELHSAGRNGEAKAVPLDNNGHPDFTKARVVSHDNRHDSASLFLTQWQPEYDQRGRLVALLDHSDLGQHVPHQKHHEKIVDLNRYISCLSKLILDEETEPQDISFYLKNLIALMSNSNEPQEIQESLESIVASPNLNPETTRIYMIEFTEFLKNIGPIDSMSLHIDPKQSNQEFIIEQIFGIIKSESYKKVQDIEVKDALIQCLLDTYNNTSPFGKNTIVYVLTLQNSCHTNSTILKQIIELMISILNNDTACRYPRHRDAHIVLSAIKEKGIPMELVQLIPSIDLAIQAYDQEIQKIT